MLALRPDLAHGHGLRAVFVDDDVAECCDPKVAALGLLRVIFAEAPRDHGDRVNISQCS